MDKKVLTGIIIGAVIVVAGAVFALTRNSNNSSETTNPDSAQNVQQNPQDNTDEIEDATIVYSDEGFSPDTVTVKKGDRVRVTNESTIGLQFSSDDHPTHLKQPELNMQTLEPNQSDTFVVTKVGTWGFHNHLDASKTGTLIVTE